MMHAFEVLADPVRRRILEVLTDGEHASGEVVKIVGADFGIGQSAVSQHLKVLRDSGFANVTVDGARRIYSIDPKPLAEVDEWMSRFRRFWGPKLDALATEVARGKRRRRRAGRPPVARAGDSRQADHGIRRPQNGLRRRPR